MPSGNPAVPGEAEDGLHRTEMIEAANMNLNVLNRVLSRLEPAGPAGSAWGNFVCFAHRKEINNNHSIKKDNRKCA